MASFTCETNEEAVIIQNAVNRYGRWLKESGVDLRNYWPAGEGTSGFGWDAVQRMANQLHKGSITHASALMLEAVERALRHAADTTDPDTRRRRLALASRAQACAAYDRQRRAKGWTN